jgi:hypothetical protein
MVVNLTIFQFNVSFLIKLNRGWAAVGKRIAPLAYLRIRAPRWFVGILGSIHRIGDALRVT